MDALHPDRPDDDPRWVRCAVYTRQSVKRAGDDPAVTSCAIQRMRCTEFIRSKTWDYWYPIAERVLRGRSHCDSENFERARWDRLAASR